MSAEIVAQYCLRMLKPGLPIAVVDDDVAVRVMLRRVLRLAEFCVTEFSSGEHFLAALEVEHPACAVVDLQMPGISGLEVLTRMRNANVQVPVIFITASDDVTLARSGTAAACSQLLRKPFSSSELLDAIAAAIASRNQTLS